MTLDLDFVRAQFPAFSEPSLPPVSGKLSAALFISNFQVGRIGQ